MPLGWLVEMMRQNPSVVQFVVIERSNCQDEPSGMPEPVSCLVRCPLFHSYVPAG